MFGARATVFLAALTAFACTDRDALLTGAPCPCGGGDVCCEYTQRCVASADACAEPYALDRLVPSRGPTEGGVVVAFEGRGLERIEAVRIGGEACELIESGARPACVAPAGPESGGLGDVEIEIDGRVEVLSGGFEWLAADFVERFSARDDGVRAFGTGGSLYDVDGDGRLEVLLSWASGYPTEPDLTRPLVYSVGPRLALEPFEAFPDVVPHLSLVAGDVDGDGTADLLTGGLVGRTSLTVLRREDDVVRVEPQTGVVERAPGVRFFDLDADGRLDIIGCQRATIADGSPQPFVALNQGGTLRTAPEAVQGPGTRLPCRGIDAGDYDGDGDADWLFVGEEHVFYERRGDRLVDVTAEVGLPPPFEQWSGTGVFLDYDLDGDLDIALVPSARPNLIWDTDFDSRAGIWIGENVEAPGGGRRFRRVGPIDLSPRLPCGVPSNTLPDASLRYGARSVTVLDVDRDGDEDLFMPLPEPICGLSPMWYDNRAAQGQVGFVARPVPVGQFLQSTNAAMAGDLDRDGDVDVVVHNWGAGRRTVFENVQSDRQARKNRGLRIRARTATGEARALPIEVDLDGPNFASGDRIRRRTLGSGGGRGGTNPPEVIVGLLDHRAPVWVRVRFEDGSVVVREVGPNETDVVLEDCEAERCP